MKIGKLHCAVIAALCFGAGYFINQEIADNTVSGNDIVRNLEAALVKSTEQTELLRENAFSSIDSIKEILQLPYMFDQMEAGYSLVGRSQAIELFALLHDADRVADISVRQRLLGIIMSRLVSLNPSLALEAVADGSYYGETKLIDAVWAEWSQNDFDAALAHANNLSGSERKIAALALMAANGYMANARTNRIVAELGVQADTHIRTQFIISLADESPLKAIDYLNEEASNWIVNNLVATFAYHMARQDVLKALEFTELFSEPSARRNYQQIVLGHAAKENPAAIIERSISSGDNKPNANELYNAAYYLVETDLDAAMGYLQQLPKGDAYQILANQIATKLTDQNFDEALAWAQDAGLGDNDEVLTTVLQSQLSKDPDSVMRYAAEFAEQGRSALLDRVLSRWTSIDPQAAVNWLRNSEIDSIATWNGLGTTLAYTDLDMAKKQLAVVPEEFAGHWKQSIAGQIVSKHSAEEALRWVSQYKNDSDYSQLMSSTIQYLTHYDFDSALSLTNAIEDSAQRDQLYLAITQQTAYRDTEKALATAQRISDQSLRERAQFAPTSHWFRNKPREAEQWLNKLSAGDQRDMAIVSAASTWSRPSSEQLQLISSISDKDMQKHAWIMNLGNQLSENKSLDYSYIEHSGMDVATQQAIVLVFDVMRSYR